MSLEEHIPDDPCQPNHTREDHCIAILTLDEPRHFVFAKATRAPIHTSGAFDVRTRNGVFVQRGSASRTTMLSCTSCRI
jgi:hypothetical protein